MGAVAKFVDFAVFLAAEAVFFLVVAITVGGTRVAIRPLVTSKKTKKRLKQLNIIHEIKYVYKYTLILDLILCGFIWAHSELLGRPCFSEAVT